MALKKDTAFDLTGSQLLGWELGDTSLLAFIDAIRNTRLCLKKWFFYEWH
ncbi:hypothetical protein [Nostoc sp. C052]|nr:hypothetical protein [Nostoc sp. C052]